MLVIIKMSVLLKQIFQGTHSTHCTPSARNYSTFKFNCNEINKRSDDYASIDLETKTCFDLYISRRIMVRTFVCLSSVFMVV